MSQPHTRLLALKGKPKYAHTPDSTHRRQCREKLFILASTPQPVFLEVLMSHFLKPVFEKKLLFLSQIYSDVFWLPSRWEMGPASNPLNKPAHASQSHACNRCVGLHLWEACTANGKKNRTNRFHLKDQMFISSVPSPPLFSLINPRDDF